MSNRDIDHAKAMLGNAVRDLRAAREMRDPIRFAPETFGFHVQQCVEKSLKAWLSCLGLPYPRSHDISALKTALEDSGCDLSAFQNIEELTVFAIQYRYEAYSNDEEDLDRDALTDLAERIYDHVAALVS